MFVNHHHDLVLNQAEGQLYLYHELHIVTGYEMWIHHYELQSKHQSIGWKYMTSPPKRKFRSLPTVYGAMKCCVTS